MTDHAPSALVRAWRGLVGPLPPQESAVVLGASAATVAVVWRRTRTRSGPLAGLTMAGLAFDLAGGLLAFQLPATRAAYTSKPRSARLRFVAAHAHPFLLPLLGDASWRRAGARYAAALGATVVLEGLDERGVLTAGPRRVVATGASAGAALVDLSRAGTTERWFGPLYLLKLIGGHGGIPRAQPPPAAGSAGHD